MLLNTNIINIYRYNSHFKCWRLLFQSKRRRRRGILRIEDFPEEIAKNKIIFLLNEIFAHFIFLHNLVLMKKNLCKGYLRRLQLSEKPWLSGKSGHLLIHRTWVQFQPFLIVFLFFSYLVKGEKLST